MRTLAVRAKKKAIAVRCRWRRIYLGVKRIPRPEDEARIQMILRRYVAGVLICIVFLWGGFVSLHLHGLIFDCRVSRMSCTPAT